MKVLVFGEVVVGTGVIHQDDFVKALDAERLTSQPKDLTDVRVIVGRLLKGKKPTLLAWAESKNLPSSTVDEVLAPEVVERLAKTLTRKKQLAGYERRALEALSALIVPTPVEPHADVNNLELQVLVMDASEPTRKKRGKKGKVANG